MCGFLGEISNSCLSNSIEFNSLLDLSIHRGPDSQLIVSGVDFQLGFNRLAIQDVSEFGNQPMWSPSQRFVTVFNGEIYNFLELKKQYDLAGLKSQSDTEVLVCLFELLGVEKTFTLLDGMFAIAVLDTEKDTLYLTRDFAGIKPLFYGVSKQGIVFASQFNQIFKHDFFKKYLVLRKDLMKEYFGLGYMQAPNTIYKNIHQVTPGELLVFKEGICISQKRLKSFEFNKCSEKFDLETYAEKLEHTVSNQLISDVPLATFLSGGIDSPLITAMAHEQQKSIEAFTLGVHDLKLDESKKANSYAKTLDVNHTIETIEEQELLEQVNTHFKYFGEPFGDYSSIPTYLITKKARKKYTVMLSGDGADELFFGYPRMQDVLDKKHWFLWPYGFRKFWIRLLNKIGIQRTWAPIANRTFIDFLKGKQTHLADANLNLIFPKTRFSSETENLFKISKKEPSDKLLEFLRWSEFYGHLQRVLIKVDRMAMANSMEVRVPFLGKEVLEYAWNFSPVINRNKFDLKKPLKDLLEKFISSDIIEQDKKGFSVPIEKWLHNELKNDVKKMIFNRNIYGAEVLNVDALRSYVNDYYLKNHNEFWGVWHVYAWQKWALAEGLIN